MLTMPASLRSNIDPAAAPFLAARIDRAPLSQSDVARRGDRLNPHRGPFTTQRCLLWSPLNDQSQPSRRLLQSCGRHQRGSRRRHASAPDEDSALRQKLCRYADRANDQALNFELLVGAEGRQLQPDGSIQAPFLPTLKEMSQLFMRAWRPRGRTPRKIH